MSVNPDYKKHAAELHRQAIIIDGHSDILMPLTDGKIRLGEKTNVPDPKTWQPPFNIHNQGLDEESLMDVYDSYFTAVGQYSVPQFLEGGLTVQVCAIYMENKHLERAVQRGLEMAWCLLHETEINEDFDLVTSVADIRRIKKEGKSGAVLSFEGFEPLGYELRFLDLYYRLGLRMASLTHNRRNFFADGTQYHIKTGGLTDTGKKAVQRMNELGIVVDLGHINQVGFWEVMELTSQPLVVSHQTPTQMYPLDPTTSPFHPARDVSRGRERLEALQKNGGVFGVIFYGQKDTEDIINDIEYLLEIIGPDHIGLGTDLCGYGKAPKGLEDIGKLPLFTEALLKRGHSDEFILKFLGENYLRVFEQVWKN